ncbi:uncharacterized protein C2orf80 [Synchiropus picturatus]
MMESKQLKRNVEVLIGNYVGRKLRENNFDPKGKVDSSMLDDLAHYDLAVSVALWWLDKDVQDHRGITWDLTGSDLSPDRSEREAMILSSFAGILMNSIPVEEILNLYRHKPSATFSTHGSKGSIVCPFSLSYHPFAMLSSYKAVHHSKTHNQKLKRWLTGRTNMARVQAPTSSSSQSFVSDSCGTPEERDEHYEGSQESLRD